MTMIMRRVAATATLLALPLGLAACGGSKPSKADVKSGMQHYVQKTLKEEGSGSSSLSDASLKKYSDCIVDKVYDDVSADALNAMKDGDNDAKVKQSDKDAVSQASKDCAGKLTAAG